MIHSFEVLLSWFGTSPLFHVRFKLLLLDLHTDFSGGRSDGIPVSLRMLHRRGPHSQRLQHSHWGRDRCFLELSCFVVSYAYIYVVTSTCCFSLCEMSLFVSGSISCFKGCFGTSLVAQWLRLCSQCRGLGSVSGQWLRSGTAKFIN